MHYLLIYQTAEDYLTRRNEFRKAHLKLAWEFADRGELILAGAVGDPIESAILFFSCDSPKIPAAFAEVDPYVQNGLVKKWSVQPWHTVIGPTASNQLR